MTIAMTMTLMHVDDEMMLVLMLMMQELSCRVAPIKDLGPPLVSYSWDIAITASAFHV